MSHGGGSESSGTASRAPSMADATMQEAGIASFRRLGVADDEAEAPKSGQKKREAKSSVADKNGRGLRQFSTRVCEKVQSEGITTYSKVADELVAEYQDPCSNLSSPDQQFDDKNIRRRVYDALNVLMAMDVISKDKKNIQWKGLPRTASNEIQDLKAEFMGLKCRIDQKSAYLQELQDQYIGLQSLVERNERLYGPSNCPPAGVSLPFIMVKTRPHANVEVAISEDMQLVHFDFNSTPFELHDDTRIIKELNFCESETGAMNGASLDGGHVAGQTQKLETEGRYPASPVPGILKGRIRHAHQL